MHHKPGWGNLESDLESSGRVENFGHEGVGLVVRSRNSTKHLTQPASDLCPCSCPSHICPAARDVRTSAGHLCCCPSSGAQGQFGFVGNWHRFVGNWTSHMGGGCVLPSYVNNYSPPSLPHKSLLYNPGGEVQKCACFEIL